MHAQAKKTKSGRGRPARAEVGEEKAKKAAEAAEALNERRTCRFDGGQVRERIIRTRVNAVLADLPPAVRKLRYDEEYKRQTELFTIRSATRNDAPEARGTHNGYDLFGNRFV